MTFVNKGFNITSSGLFCNPWIIVIERQRNV
jgi:hypothetical protein